MPSDYPHTIDYRHSVKSVSKLAAQALSVFATTCQSDAKYAKISGQRKYTLKSFITGDKPLTYSIRPMVKEDLDQVNEIDREAFPSQWPPANYRQELQNKIAHYIVALR